MKTRLPVFLKWAGGKRRILEALVPLFPDAINTYYEPFLGGGTVFFFLKKNFPTRKYVISDINRDLILTYISVRDSLEKLLQELSDFKERNSEKFYYATREEFNDGSLKDIRRAAAFIYMNKTCYSGLYRVNSKNKFNVPYGRLKNPEIFNEALLREASSMLQGVEILCQDYREIVTKVTNGDFIYLDPCYDPISKTSFVQYTPEKFSDSDRENLSSFVNQLKDKGANVLLSNNDIKKLRKEYRDLYPGFIFHRILAPRSLGSRVGADKQIIELAISNYS